VLFTVGIFAKEALSPEMLEILTFPEMLTFPFAMLISIPEIFKISILVKSRLPFIKFTFVPEKLNSLILLKSKLLKIPVP
jgi:hypothetical protein